MTKMIPLWQREQQERQILEQVRLRRIAAKLKRRNNQAAINPFEVLKKMPEGWTGKINVGNK